MRHLDRNLHFRLHVFADKERNSIHDRLVQSSWHWILLASVFMLVEYKTPTANLLWGLHHSCFAMNMSSKYGSHMSLVDMVVPYHSQQFLFTFSAGCGQLQTVTSHEQFIKMGQVQNGRLYKRYRSSSQKNEAQECKKLTNYIPLLS